MCGRPLSAAGLQILQLTEASTRTEKGAPVPGLLVVASTPPSSPSSSRKRIGEVIMKTTMRLLAAVALAAMCCDRGRRAGEGAARGRRQVGGVLSAAVGDRAARLLQGRRPRRRDFRRRERRPRLAVDRRRQRRDRHRHLRPRHPDAGQEPAGGGAAAIRPLSGLRAGDDGRQGRPLQIAEGPQGAEDRRDLARLQHAFHGGLHDGAQRAQGRRRLVHRHRHHLDRGRGGAAAPRSTPSSAPIR